YELVRRTAEGLAQFRDRPMLICWGGMDFVFDRHFLDEWTRRFPKAEVHRFADAGHYVLEDAGEQIIPLVKDFLARHPII
ncbi:MAG: alpha/beta hydrolase, partial [Elusimicrobia bacterium]|nr:alpha/beta hydrolase [Elusimicrobiota bacterium]